MKHSLLILLSLLLIKPISAQTPIDTVAVESDVKIKELVLPVALIGVGSLGFVEPVQSFRYEVRDRLDEWRGERRFHADDYMQYLPLASVYGVSLLGEEAKNSYLDRTLELVTSYIALGVMVNGIKYTVREPRPDGTANNSFPSGHTATAFMGAELMRLEYGEESPWYTIGAYSVATCVGLLRVYNNRHWVTDVVAGAGVGILSARIGHWLLPYTKRALYRLTGHEALVYPSISTNGAQVGVAVTF